MVLEAEKYSAEIATIPLAGIGMTMSVIALNSLIALAYFPVLWFGLALIVRLASYRNHANAPSGLKGLFLITFAPGMALLAFVAIAVALRGGEA